MYGPSFEPDWPSCADDLYSAEEICGVCQSAAAKAVR